MACQTLAYCRWLPGTRRMDMAGQSARDDEQIIVIRSGDRIMLIRSDLGGDGWSTDLELHLWRQIVPVALDQDPEIRSELMSLDAHDQVGFYALDELKSFFNLACVLSESRESVPVVKLA